MPRRHVDEVIVRIRARITELCHHAHADMRPDDLRYELIKDALGAIEDRADEDRLDLDALFADLPDLRRESPDWAAPRMMRGAFSCRNVWGVWVRTAVRWRWFGGHVCPPPGPAAGRPAQVLSRDE